MPITLGGGITRGQHAGIAHTKAMVDTWFRFIVKQVTETVNNSNVMQDDDEFTFPVLANEVWNIFFYPLVDIKAASDWKRQWVIPAGATMRLITNDQAGTVQMLDATAVRNNMVGGAFVCCPMEHLIYEGGANAGNIQLQWAQVAAIAEDTSVLLNSFLYGLRLQP